MGKEKILEIIKELEKITRNWNMEEKRRRETIDAANKRFEEKQEYYLDKTEKAIGKILYAAGVPPESKKAAQIENIVYEYISADDKAEKIMRILHKN